jgi:hypothetical protein
MQRAYCVSTNLYFYGQKIKYPYSEITRIYFVELATRHSCQMALVPRQKVRLSE